MTTFSAPAPTQAIRPAYQVTPLEGTFRQRRCRHVSGKGFEYFEEDVDAGYLVNFPRGHSIRVLDFKELTRLGFAEAIPLVHMETGDTITVLPAAVKPKE